MAKNIIGNLIMIPEQGPKFKHARVHHILSWPIICLLALAVGIFSSTISIEQDAANNGIELDINTAKAQELPPKQLKDFTSVDVMKLTKDTMTNQLSNSDILSVVTALKGLHVRYIAISVPLDSTTDYPSSSKPSPRTAEEYTQAWADAIHNSGMHVIFRGTFSGIEGLYNFPTLAGDARFPAGTAATAATDGGTTWLGKIYAYIVNHPNYFETGDMWAPLPERTEGIFQDQTSFLPYSGGIQLNYISFFKDLQKTSNLAFVQINKKVYTGFTANNFSEVQSGWLDNSLFGYSGITAVDYYGTNHTPQEMDSSLRDIYKKTGQQIFLEEWSDYWDQGLSSQQKTSYLASMYAEFQTLANQGILAGFNYWGGWSGGTGEGILEQTATGYQLNAQGQQLAKFFAQNQ